MRVQRGQECCAIFPEGLGAIFPEGLQPGAWASFL